MNPEVTPHKEEQMDLFTEDDTTISKTTEEVDLTEASFEDLRGEYQDLFNFPADEAWSREQLLSAIFSPTGKPIEEETTTIDYSSLSYHDLESAFKAKLSRDGSQGYSPNGLPKEAIVGYLNGSVSFQEIIHKLNELARLEDKEDLKNTYRR